MNVLIVIHYISSDNNVMRRGSMPLRGRKKEAAALDFWKWIKQEHPFPCELEKITADGEDITEKVKDLESEELSKFFE